MEENYAILFKFSPAPFRENILHSENLAKSQKWLTLNLFKLSHYTVYTYVCTLMYVRTYVCAGSTVALDKKISTTCYGLLL